MPGLSTKRATFVRVRSVMGTVLLGAAAIALGLVGIWQYFRTTGPVGASQVAVHGCLAAYRRAATASDSQIVDATSIIVSRAQAPNARTCGSLRRDGALASPARREP